jgi:hypothetical protein
MKKYIATILILTMCLTIVCGCSSKNVDPTNNSEPTVSTNANENPTSSNTNPSEAIPDPSEPNQEDVLHILDLKPTGEIVTVPELAISEWWSTKTQLNDISHINGGTYSYVKNHIGVSLNNWDDMKNVKIAEITRSVDVGSYNVSVMRPAGQYMSHSVVSYVFGNETSAMTVGQAYDNGMYKCVLTSALDSDFDNLMTKITGEYEDPVQAIIETWGMPSEVYYTDFTYHYAFKLIYKVDDSRSIVFTGYEKLEDFDQGYRMNFDTISIYGNNSQAMKDLTAEDEYNIKL